MIYNKNPLVNVACLVLLKKKILFMEMLLIQNKY